MIKYYLIVYICTGSFNCSIYEHYTHGTKEIQYFETEEECTAHAFEDAKVLAGRAVVVEALCKPIQGA